MIATVSYCFESQVKSTSSVAALFYQIIEQENRKGTDLLVFIETIESKLAHSFSNIRQVNERLGKLLSII